MNCACNVFNSSPLDYEGNRILVLAVCCVPVQTNHVYWWKINFNFMGLFLLVSNYNLKAILYSTAMGFLKIKRSYYVCALLFETNL